MRFAEVNILGVFVAPIVPMMLAAWLILVPLRRLAARYGLFRYVWHPSLCLFAAYVTLLSLIVMAVSSV